MMLSKHYDDIYKLALAFPSLTYKLHTIKLTCRQLWGSVSPVTFESHVVRMNTDNEATLST